MQDFQDQNQSPAWNTKGNSAEQALADLQAQLTAISKSQAIIEFDMDGKILTANQNFCNVMGYHLDEIKGQHHRMFAEWSYANSHQYQAFWEKLRRGEYEAGQFKRIGKGGREVWIQASYNPILNEQGKPYKVVKYATDISSDKLREADFSGQLAAIGKSQAVIEFSTDGTIITANENFCNALGYTPNEIQGKHHSMFVEPHFAASIEYKMFWDKLKRGEFEEGQFKRIGKGGKEVWIQASYNPIFDMNGRPFKVVKYATDITTTKLRNADFAGQLEAIGKVQAIIEFNLNGTILTANDNFCHTMGYSLAEIQGQHHSMFAEAEYTNSNDYRLFWDKLRSGEYVSGQFKRLGKGGREVWIQASYNPIFDMNGRPFKVVKFAIDITKSKLRNADVEGQLGAINKAQAVIEFSLDGTILTANDNFCKTMGYSLSEIQGQHHRIFADPEYARSPEYRYFWDKLARGDYDAGQYKRIARGGREVWIQASYNPILDMNGKPFKVVKYATDITEEKLRNADYAGQLGAIGKAQAIIEFTMDGTILTANENFCQTMGYTMDQIKGQHHRIFIDPNYARSPEYRHFWDKLNRGEFERGEYKRLGNGGREVWIQASYNPIFDLNGKPFKVVKYASNITETKLRNADFEGQLEAINKAQAVIEFSMDGTILNANENFCKAMGYTLDEIKGQHHRIFADPAYANSSEYQLFWEKLRRGEFEAGQFKRLGKGGREVWIQASYNPILNMNGQPFKVVKYATDITEQVQGATDMARVLGALAQGDLTETITRDYTGNFKKVKDDANATVANLSGIIEGIIEAAHAINIAATEIGDGNKNLSQRTEEQAASLEETASSMEELTSTVRQNADNARKANQLASAASDVAIKGGSVVSQVVSTMSSINESSKKIVEIISVIDGIAFQTNILALNAAVEAARAGEQGRGFAVVASEVRNLAQRSAGAAKEIKTLIGDSVNKVSQGTKLVESAGKTMDEIVGSFNNVTSVIRDITSASDEQSTGINQINQAITQMDTVTQQNAALVEQASAASESMIEQANLLSESVSIFKLSGQEGSWGGRQPVVKNNLSRPPLGGANKQANHLINKVLAKTR